jgi:hypothetical protein
MRDGSDLLIGKFPPGGLTTGLGLSLEIELWGNAPGRGLELIKSLPGVTGGAAVP